MISIHYLQRLPFDTIKIDKSFIQRLPDNKDDAAIVEAIVAMAHSLELEVITEGVETHGQLKFINELNCHAIQGYYFSPPISIDKCMQLVKQKNILMPDSNHQAKSSSSD
jgi:diguanylate cyclase